MGEILIFGEKQSGKSTLIKLCMNANNTRQDVSQDFQIWTDKQNNIIFYETHLNSSNNFEALYAKMSRIKYCKMSWFLIPASGTVSSISDMIYPILAKKIRIVFIITKCDLAGGNTRLEEEIHEEFGPKHQIMRISIKQGYNANQSELKAQINELFSITNSYLKIFPQVAAIPIKPIAKPRSNSSMPSNTPVVSKMEPNSAEQGLLAPLLDKRFNRDIEIFFMNFGDACKEKSTFIKDFIGDMRATTVANGKFQIYELCGGKFVIYDILEIISDEISIIDALKKIRPGNKNAFSLFSFFVPNKNLKSDIDLLINKPLRNFLSSSPKIFISFKAKVKCQGFNALNSEMFIQAPKEERQNLVAQSFINHVIHASTFNSEKNLFLTGVQKFITLVSILIEPYCSGVEQLRVAPPVSKHSSVNFEEKIKAFNSNPVQTSFPHKLSRIEEAKLKYEKNMQGPAAPNQDKRPYPNNIPRPMSNDQANKPYQYTPISSSSEQIRPTYSSEQSSTQTISTKNVNTSFAPKLSLIEQRKAIFETSVTFSETASQRSYTPVNKNVSPIQEPIRRDPNREDFSILVIGEPNSGQNMLISAMIMKDITKNIDKSKEFNIFATNFPVSFIEYHGKMSSMDEIHEFIERFRSISIDKNCLMCWNTINNEVDIYSKELLKELRTKLNIPSFLVYSNILPTEIGAKLKEEPANYNAEYICWMPTLALIIDIDGKKNRLDEFVYDILEHSKKYVNNKQKIILANLKNNRANIREVSFEEPYEEFEFERSVENPGNERINLMLIGPTGVGKSTLINALLKNNIACVSHTESCTMGFVEYEIPNAPITLIDSRGFELKEFIGTKTKVDKEIERRSHDKLKRVHMIWYCVKMDNKRFVEEENAMINEWRAKGIPIIIVVTHAVSKANLDTRIKEDFNIPTYEDFKNSIDKSKIISKGVIILKVLAKKEIKIDLVTKITTTYPAYGITSLIDLMGIFLPPEIKYLSTHIKRKHNVKLTPVEEALKKVEVDMINIMLIGNSGSGKSQLIKTIFNINIDSRPGRSITQEIKQYMAPNKPFSLFDTVGFELGRYQQIKDQIMDEINKRAKLCPSKRIHLIWYVINDSGSRIQASDKEVISDIMFLKIPIIIVLNNGHLSHLGIYNSLLNGDINGIKIPDMNQLIKTTGDARKKLIAQKISVIKTNAKETTYIGDSITPAYGTNELVQLSQFYINGDSDNALNSSIINCDQKHSHIKKSIIPRYQDNIKKDWIFSTKSRENILNFNILKMYREITAIYGFKWTEKACEDIISTADEKCNRFNKRCDKLTGGAKFFGAIKTRGDTIDFIRRVGEVFSESLKSLVIRTDNPTKVNLNSHIGELEELLEFEFT